MKTNHLCLLFIICFIVFFFHQGTLSASSDKTPNEFKFYKIGNNDSLGSAKKKLNDHRFECLSGRTALLDIKSVEKELSRKNLPKKLETISSMDADFEINAKGMEYEEMPIDVLICSPLAVSPFTESTHYFSRSYNKIMAIRIVINNFERVKNKMVSKFGSCIQDGYCEIGNSIIIISERSNWQLQVYFYGNLKAHFDRLKKENDLINKKIQRSIDEAF